ncbi:hypothetical protein [Leptolyngbya sp. Cla-17]|nr:hypothetical protein [Leptolyngbya sp. Cla-17]
METTAIVSSFEVHRYTVINQALEKHYNPLCDRSFAFQWSWL